MAKPPIVIDWDGTLVENAWPGFGEWRPGAVDALKQLVEVAQVVIYTCRIAPVQPDGKTKRHPARVQAEINNIRAKLDDAGLYTVIIHNQRWKPGGIAYVDDRAVRYTGRKNSWAALVPKLINMTGNYEEAVAADDSAEVHR